jgi:hypothetical protein
MKEVAYPEGADIFVNALNKACKTDFLLKGGEFTVINRASDGKKEAVHILNYDNTRKVDAELIYPDSFGNPELLNPSAFGCESFDKTRESVIIKGLGTYCCVVFDKKRITGKRSK